jgi:hypothetical protein
MKELRASGPLGLPETWLRFTAVPHLLTYVSVIKQATGWFVLRSGPRAAAA